MFECDILLLMMFWFECVQWFFLDFSVDERSYLLTASYASVILEHGSSYLTVFV